jgi:hypothetical protein
MARELQVLQDYYDLSLYLTEHILRFPRNLRYGLGLAMERRLQDLLALLVRAKYAPASAKEPVLREVNVELEVLRFQLRQSAELRALPANGQRHALQRLEQVGQQVGGWLRSLRATVPPPPP